MGGDHSLAGQASIDSAPHPIEKARAAGTAVLLAKIVSYYISVSVGSTVRMVCRDRGCFTVAPRILPRSRYMALRLEVSDAAANERLFSAR